ncbi:hypothetical protein [Nocardia miyunensis]|nr:hypothetical protein [Nocardia miyunensis]
MEQILARYGSLEAFCTRLRRDLDDPTIELPHLPEVRPSPR